MGKRWLGKFVCCLLLWPAGHASMASIPVEWTTPIAPFRIADNLYYVGSKALAAYLVVTPAGDILINSDLENTSPLIGKSVAQLGFRMRDIKILLISHAHYDHDAGSAEIKRLTGASYMVMDADVPTVESGGAKDFMHGTTYPATRVDRILHDGDTVSLGGVDLVAHKTAGHTRGCTTWTLRVPMQGHLRNVVIVGSWHVNEGVRLVDRPGHPASYPGIAADYAHTFVVLSQLPCDVFLGAHGEFFAMMDKLKRAQAGAGESVWTDPTGYKEAVAEAKHDFEDELKRQQASRL